MDKDFDIKKINLDREEVKVSQRKTASKLQKNVYNKEMVKKSKKSAKRVFSILFFVLLFLGVFFIFGLYLPAKKVYSNLQNTIQAAKKTAEAVKNQDVAESLQKLKETEEKLVDLKSSYEKLGFLSYFPFVGNYYKDGKHGLSAGIEVVKAAQIGVEEITPYADLLGLSSGESSFVDQPADKRIEVAITTFSKVTPKLSIISEYLSKAKEEIDQIDAARYPVKIGNTEVRSRISKGKETADQTIGLFVDAKPLLEILPELLGIPEKKTYLVLFQNDKELRSTGGFITAYAAVSFEKGKMKVEKSEDIYVLDDKQKKRIAAPPEILKYHKGVSYFNLRDSNLSPDFSESIKLFEELYKNTGSDLTKDYDGVFAVDTHVLLSVLQVLDGEVYVPEYDAKFTTAPDERCDGCPQVIYELELYADKPVGYFRGERKDILGKLLYHLMQKALGVSPSQYWGKLTQALLSEINEKHILGYMFDSKAQNAFEALNFAGRIKDFDADYLHINDTNFAGAKSNMFVKHYIKQEIEIDKSGKIVKTLTIDYKNPSPPSDCGFESGGLCLNALLRNWVRIYIPEGSKLLEFTGSETETESKEELQKTVFEGFLTVRPQGSSQAIVKYELPFAFSGKEYKMLMQKQPGTEGHEVTIYINGKQVDKFNLETDRELKYKI